MVPRTGPGPPVAGEGARGGCGELHRERGSARLVGVPAPRPAQGVGRRARVPHQRPGTQARLFPRTAPTPRGRATWPRLVWDPPGGRGRGVSGTSEQGSGSRTTRVSATTSFFVFSPRAGIGIYAARGGAGSGRRRPRHDRGLPALVAPDEERDGAGGDPMVGPTRAEEGAARGGRASHGSHPRHQRRSHPRSGGRNENADVKGERPLDDEWGVFPIPWPHPPTHQNTHTSILHIGTHTYTPARARETSLGARSSAGWGQRGSGERKRGGLRGREGVKRRGIPPTQDSTRT